MNGSHQETAEFSMPRANRCTSREDVCCKLTARRQLVVVEMKTNLARFSSPTCPRMRLPLQRYHLPDMICAGRLKPQQGKVTKDHVL